ncbi:MAG: hypothetical protein ACUVV6_05685 [Thermoplasmatota archaeon]
MEAKLFAIKLERRIKEAMDFISRETGDTLTRLYYKPIEETTYEILGRILLRRLEGVDIGERSVPPIVEEFVQMMEKRDIKEEFRRIFSGVQFVDKEWLVYDMDMRDIQSHVGRAYIDAGGGFEKINRRFVKELLFSYMLQLTYKLTAMGMFKNLDDEWRRNTHRIERFREWLVRKHEDLYGHEVVEVEEVYEAEVLEAKRGLK